MTMKFNQIPNWTPGYLHVCPHHIHIRVRCEACGIEKDFDRDALPGRFHHALIEKIEERLKCECGEKRARLLFGHLAAEA